jgi:hypothetical protein
MWKSCWENLAPPDDNRIQPRIPNGQVRCLERELFHLFENSLVDQVAVCHAITLVDVPHTHAVALDSGLFHSIPIVITDVSFL